MWRACVAVDILRTYMCAISGIVFASYICFMIAIVLLCRVFVVLVVARTSISSQTICNDRACVCVSERARAPYMRQADYAGLPYVGYAHTHTQLNINTISPRHEAQTLNSQRRKRRGTGDDRQQQHRHRQQLLQPQSPRDDASRAYRGLKRKNYM